MKKLLLTASLLAFAACKKQPEPSGPKLGAPEAGGYTRELVPAAATVTASSGPVKITLSMPTTFYRVDSPSLWVKVSLTNVGDAPFDFFSHAFVFGAPQLMRPDPMTLEVVQVSGKRAIYVPPETDMPPRRCWPEHAKLGRRELIRRFMFSLDAGASTSTPVGAYVPLEKAWCEGTVMRPKFPDFGEIPGFHFDPGNYQVRAVYNRLPSTGLSSLTAASEPEEVRVATPWIRIRVEQ